MWKWVNKAGRMLATVLLLSFLSVWTTGYIVNSYIESLLKQFGVPLQVQPPGLSGFWGKLWGADLPKGEEVQKEAEALAMSRSTESSANRHFSESGPPETQVPTSGTSTPESGPPKNVPRSDETENAQPISEDDREILRSIMMQMNEEQLLQLTQIMENNGDKQERERAINLLRNTLNEEDYNILMEILSRTFFLEEETPHPAQDQAF